MIFTGKFVLTSRREHGLKIKKTPATDMMLTNVLTNTSPNLPPRVV